MYLPERLSALSDFVSKSPTPGAPTWHMELSYEGRVSGDWGTTCAGTTGCTPISNLIRSCGCRRSRNCTTGTSRDPWCAQDYPVRETSVVGPPSYWRLDALPSARVTGFARRGLAFLGDALCLWL